MGFKTTSIREMLDEFANGLFDNTKSGECVCCGGCCSNYLPLSKKEIERLRYLVEKRKLKPHTKVNALMAKRAIDATCPFLTAENRCEIYEHRPDICKVYKCDKYKETCNMSLNKYHLTDVRREVFGIDETLNYEQLLNSMHGCDSSKC